MEGVIGRIGGGSLLEVKGKEESGGWDGGSWILGGNGDMVWWRDIYDAALSLEEVD